MNEILNKIESMLEKGLVSSVSIKTEKVGEYQKTNIDIKASEETTFNIDTLNLNNVDNFKKVSEELAAKIKRSFEHEN